MRAPSSTRRFQATSDARAGDPFDDQRAAWSSAIRLTACSRSASASPTGYTEADGEIVVGIAGQVVVALQHQRLAEECERLAAAEQHSRRLEHRVERLRGALAGQYGFDSIVGRSPLFARR